jgi:hypothetical protein
MKEQNNVLKYTLKGEITDMTDEGRIEVLAGKNADDISLPDFYEDVCKWFKELPEGATVDFTFQAKEIKK